MALTPEQQQQVSARFQDQLSALPREKKEPLSVNKHAILAAAAGMDAWVDANAASFNAAIPEPARTALTPAQKRRLFFWVVRAHFDPEDE